MIISQVNSVLEFSAVNSVHAFFCHTSDVGSANSHLDESFGCLHGRHALGLANVAGACQAVNTSKKEFHV